MSLLKLPLCSAVLALFAVTPALISTSQAQSDSIVTPVKTPVGAAVGTVVPRLVKFSGSIPDSAGSTVVLHFSLYAAQTGGEPIWSEAQSVTLSDAGKYSVLLGITTSPGLPQQLFTTGSAKWLGVKLGDGEEAPRTLLLAAPYALKASDADTLGGHPVTDFALLDSGKPETGTPITQINVGTGISGGGTGPTVTISAGPNVLTSLTGSNGLQVTQSGHAYYVTAGPGLITLGNTYFAQLAAPNTMTGKLTLNNQLFSTANFASEFAIQGINTGNLAGGVYGAAPVVGLQGASTNTASGAESYGVYAQSASAYGIGVYGYAPGGYTAIGTYGQVGSRSNTGTTLDSEGYEIGAWGDTGTTSNSSGFGVLGTGDSNTFAGVFDNNDSTGFYPTLLSQNSSTGQYSIVFETYTIDSGTVCTIDYYADLICDGNIQAVTKTSDQRKVATYAVQSSESWIEDFGSGQLSGGHAIITLEPAFAKTVNTGVDYHVFLTPNGDSKGLYVTSKGPGGFEVHESNGGSSNISFDYRIVAKRRGSENVRLADVTEQRKRAVESLPTFRPKSKPAHPSPRTNVLVVGAQAALSTAKK